MRFYDYYRALYNRTMSSGKTNTFEIHLLYILNLNFVLCGLHESYINIELINCFIAMFVVLSTDENLVP